MALCDALHHAHEQGVIHRDVKPGNVMVLAEPAAGAGFAKLADFGVAHVVSHDPLTRTGDVVGTLAYMSPEQRGAPVPPPVTSIRSRDSVRGLASESCAAVFPRTALRVLPLPSLSTIAAPAPGCAPATDAL